jgi:serine/threonine protein kinase
MPQELKIVRLYSECSSLTEVISLNPVWWTATAKAKAVAGIVLCLRVAHGFGLIHGHLNSNNIIFNVDHQVQITDFGLIDLEVGENENDSGGFAGERWSPNPDVYQFASILLEIIVGDPAKLAGVAKGQKIVHRDIPVFVSELVEVGKSPESRISESFNDIFNILKKNNFEIMSGVDSADVLAFVDWIESFE